MLEGNLSLKTKNANKGFRRTGSQLTAKLFFWALDTPLSHASNRLDFYAWFAKLRRNIAVERHSLCFGFLRTSELSC